MSECKLPEDEQEAQQQFIDALVEDIEMHAKQLRKGIEMLKLANIKLAQQLNKKTIAYAKKQS